MKIGVIGAGGVGGYFAGMLALAGHDVYLVARGSHLESIKKNGIRIEKPEGEIVSAPVSAVSSSEDAPKVDLIVVAVKGWQLDSISPFLNAFSHADSIILPLQNGVDAPEVLHAKSTVSTVIGGLCGIISHIKEPGLIKHVGIEPFVTLGSFPDQKMQSGRLQDIKDAFDGAGVIGTISDDITLSMWRKYLFICPLSAVTSVSRSTIGEVRECPQTLEVLKKCVSELRIVGNAQGVPLVDSHVEHVIKQVSNSPHGGTTSLQRDIADGRPSELETQIGTAVKLGLKHKVSAPNLEFAYSALLPQENNARRELNS